MQWESDQITETEIKVWKPSDEDMRTLRAHFKTIHDERAGAPKAIKAFPEYVEHISREAEFAVRDMVRLPGNPEKSFIGNPPNWLEKRYNDKEYLWQMNRMTHWTWMCFGYALTGNEAYAEKVCSELRNWTEVVPADYDLLKKVTVDYFSECNPMRILEVGIRLHRSWPHIINFLTESPYFTDDVIRDLAESVHYQAALLRIVSPAVWPLANHNHFIMEMLGLLTAALYFPVFPEADEWRDFAIASLERAVRAQLTEEGGQIEGCPGYHDGCMFWFGLPLVFEKRFGIRMSDEYKRLYRKSLDYSLFLMRPTGTSVPVGDSTESDRPVISGMYALECFDNREILEELKVLMTQETIERVMEEYVWYFSDTAKVLDFIRTMKPSEPDLPKVFFNHDLGQGVLKSGWNREDHNVMMTCRSPIYDNHAHIDLNSFDYVANGKIIISDPSYFCYRQDENRRYFKTTGVHSTIKVNDKDQFEYIGSFKYGPQKNGRILNVEERDFYKLITGWHDNYEPLEHLRHVLLVDNSFLIVCDVMKGGKGDKVHSNFHFDYTGMKTEGNIAYGYDEKSNVKMAVYPEYSLDQIPGRLSSRNDTDRPSTMVSFDRVIENDREEYLSVICPYREHEPSIRFEKVGSAYDASVGENTYVLHLDGDEVQLERA